jgi:hypothetical protein
MTLLDLQSKRDKLLAQLGVTAVQRENYRIDFSSGDARLKELALLDDEIDKLTSATPKTMTRFTSHSRG